MRMILASSLAPQPRGELAIIIWRHPFGLLAGRWRLGCDFTPGIDGDF
jgi:hypothetical protein